MRVLALDQATVRSGYALFNDSVLTQWGVLDARKNAGSHVRTAMMSAAIEKLVDSVKPDVVVFEDVAFLQNMSALITLARLQGCIMHMCFKRDTEFEIYITKHWRAVCGMRQSNKAERDSLKLQAIAFVKDIYDLCVEEDCAEAICIGLAHLKSHGVLQDFTRLKRTKKKEKKDEQGNRP